MKERESEEEVLHDTALALWEKLEEVEDLYLKDFPNREEHNFRFYGNVRVSINFTPYTDCRDCGIGAISIAKEENNDCQFRRDIVVKKTRKKGVVCVVKETDIDPSTNFLQGDKHYPLLERALPQPISYFEQIIQDSNNTGLIFRRPTDQELNEAIKYVEEISLGLCYIRTCRD